MADTLEHEPNDSNDVQKRGRMRPRKEVQEPVEKRKVGRPEAGLGAPLRATLRAMPEAGAERRHHCLFIN